VFDSCICVDIDEYPRVHAMEVRKARKQHWCGECGEAIEIGEEYEHYSGLWDGHWQSHKMCMTCVRIRNSLFSCGWICGEMWNDIHEVYCDEETCICPE